MGCVLVRCKQETVAAAAERRKKAKLKNQREKKKKWKKKQRKQCSSNCTSKPGRRQCLNSHSYTAVHLSAEFGDQSSKPTHVEHDISSVCSFGALEPAFHPWCLKSRHLRSGFEATEYGSCGASCAEQPQPAVGSRRMADTQHF